MLNIYFPVSQELKKCIKYIYYFENLKPEQVIHSLPFVGAGMTIFEKSELIQREESLFEIHASPTTQVNVHLMHSDTAKVLVRGEIAAFLIIFHPLGINHFISEPLASFSKDHHRSLIPFFRSSEARSNFISELGNVSSQQDKIHVIEQFLLQNYRVFSNTILEETLVHLMDLDETLALTRICRKVGTSVRTLNRLFQEHMCVSPVQFRNIYRFRHCLALQCFGRCNNIRKLAEDNNYTDHPYLVKVYKKYTGLSPKQLFGRIENDNAQHYLFSMIQNKLAEKYNTERSL